MDDPYKTDYLAYFFLVVAWSVLTFTLIKHKDVVFMITGPILFYTLCSILVVFYKGVQYLHTNAIDSWTIKNAKDLEEKLTKVIEVATDAIPQDNIRIETRTNKVNEDANAPVIKRKLLSKIFARDLFYNEFMKNWKPRHEEKHIEKITNTIENTGGQIKGEPINELLRRIDEIEAEKGPDEEKRTEEEKLAYLNLLDAPPYWDNLKTRYVGIAGRKTLPEPTSMAEYFKYSILHKLHSMLFWRSTPAFTKAARQAWVKPSIEKDFKYTWKVWLMRLVSTIGFLSMLAVFWRGYKGAPLPVPFFKKSVILKVLVNAIVVWFLVRTFFSTMSFSLESMVYSIGYLGYTSNVRSHLDMLTSYLDKLKKAKTDAEKAKLSEYKPFREPLPIDNLPDFPSQLTYEKDSDITDMSKWLTSWLRNDAMSDWTRKFALGKAAFAGMFTSDTFPVLWTAQKYITDRISYGLFVESAIIAAVVLIGFDLAKVTVIRNKTFSKIGLETALVFGALFAIVFIFLIALFGLTSIKQSRTLLNTIYEKWVSKWNAQHANMYRYMFLELEPRKKERIPQAFIQEGGAKILEAFDKFVTEIKTEFPKDGDTLKFVGRLATKPEVIKAIAQYSPLIDKAIDLPVIQNLTNDEEKKVIHGVLKSPKVLDFVANNSSILREAIDQDVLKIVQEDPKKLLLKKDLINQITNAVVADPGVITAIAKMPFVQKELEKEPVAKQVIAGIRQNPEVLYVLVDQADLIQSLAETRSVDDVLNNPKMLEKLNSVPQLLAFAASLPIAKKYIDSYPFLGDFLKNFIKSATYKRIDKLVPFLDWMLYTPFEGKNTRVLMPFKELFKKMVGIKHDNPYIIKLLVLVFVVLLCVLLYQWIYNQVHKKNAQAIAENPEKKRNQVDALMTVMKWAVCVITMLMFVLWRLDKVA